MIYKLVQTKRSPHAEYSVYSVFENKLIGSITTPIDRLKITVKFNLPEHCGEMILGSGQDTSKLSFKEKIQEALTFRVEEQGENVGYIKGEIKNIKTFGIFGYGYQYNRILTKFAEYAAYEMGIQTRKESGHYWTMYEETQIVGMVSKVQDTGNTYDQYDIYCENYLNGFWLILLAVKIDVARYSNYTQQFGAIKTKERYNSKFMPDELKQKYDATYIPRIKALDGITE